MTPDDLSAYCEEYAGRDAHKITNQIRTLCWLSGLVGEVEVEGWTRQESGQHMLQKTIAETIHTLELAQKLLSVIGDLERRNR